MIRARLLGIALCVGILHASLLPGAMERDDCEGAAIERLDKLGGKASEYKPSYPCMPSEQPPKPMQVAFSNTNLTDSELDSIVDVLWKIPNLQKLDLTYTRVKGWGLWRLVGLDSLKELNLSSTPLNEEGLEVLASLAQLTCVTLNNVHLPARAYQNFFETPGLSLKSLSLSGTIVYGDDGQALSASYFLAPLSGLKLVQLDISGALIPAKPPKAATPATLVPAKTPKIVTDKDLTPLMGMSTLEWLNISNDNLADQAISSVAMLSNLSALDLSGNNRLTDKGLGRLDRLVKLKNLNQLLLGGIGHPDTDDQEKRVIVVTNAGIEPLLELPLMALDLSNTTTLLNKKLLDHNPGLCKTLKHLGLASTGVSDRELAAIGTLTQLTQLDLSGTTVTNKGLEQLKPLVNLNRLVIDNTKATKGEFARLVAVQANLPKDVKNGPRQDLPPRLLRSLEFSTPSRFKMQLAPPEPKRP